MPEFEITILGYKILSLKFNHCSDAKEMETSPEMLTPSVVTDDTKVRQAKALSPPAEDIESDFAVMYEAVRGFKASERLIDRRLAELRQR